MPDAFQKIKDIHAPNNFWQESELDVHPEQITNDQYEKSFRALLELPIHWWSSSSSIDADNKLRKLDLIKIDREKIKNQNLPVPVDWKIADGDYLHAMTLNEDHRLPYAEVKKRLDKIYFGVVLLIVSLIVLLFAFIASLV